MERWGFFGVKWKAGQNQAVGGFWSCVCLDETQTSHVLWGNFPFLKAQADFKAWSPMGHMRPGGQHGGGRAGAAAAGGACTAH